MDAEGTGQRRMTFAGNWNDEASWSPKGDKIAFACRNEGDFNICVMDFATGNTVQLTSEGSNDHPVVVARRDEDRLPVAPGRQRRVPDLHDGRGRTERTSAS